MAHSLAPFPISRNIFPAETFSPGKMPYWRERMALDLRHACDQREVRVKLRARIALFTASGAL